MTTPASELCELPPFTSTVVPRADDPSSVQLIVQQLEGYLKRLREKACADIRYILENCCSGSGPVDLSFLDLTDTPASYAAQALKLVRVNAGETGLEFVSPAAATGGLYLDFSTTEQATPRTWVDGSVIYQKTIYRAGNLATGATSIAHGITGLSRLIWMHSTALRSNGEQVPFTWGTATSINWLLGHRVDATNVLLNVGTNWAGAGNVLSEYYGTMIYTKS